MTTQLPSQAHTRLSASQWLGFQHSLHQVVGLTVTRVCVCHIFVMFLADILDWSAAFQHLHPRKTGLSAEMPSKTLTGQTQVEDKTPYWCTPGSNQCQVPGKVSCRTTGYRERRACSRSIFARSCFSWTCRAKTFCIDAACC